MDLKDVLRDRQARHGHAAPIDESAPVDDQAPDRPAGREVNRLPVRIMDMADHFAKAAPPWFNTAALVRDGLTALRSVPKLGACEPLSVLGALMNCAQLGLRPGVANQAHLVPFWSNADGCFKASFIAGYRGLSNIATRTGRIRNICPATIRAGDEYRIVRGSSPRIEHEVLSDETSPASHYYCVVFFADGATDVEVMTAGEMAAHRDAYGRDWKKQPDGSFGWVVRGPWLNNYEQMAWKTVIRRKCKFLPEDLTHQIPGLSSVLAADESVRVNVEPDVAPEQASAAVCDDHG